MLRADHIAWLPGVNIKGEAVEVTVHFVEMTPKLINTWHYTVQSVINSRYTKFSKLTQSSKQASVATGAAPLKAVPDLTVVTEDGHRTVQATIPSTVQEVVELAEAAAQVGLEHLECAVGSGISQVAAFQGAELQVAEALPAIAQEKPKVRSRADVKWSWKRFYWMHLTYSLWCKLQRSQGASRAVCMIAKKGKREIPLGMLTLVPDFTCKILGRTKARAYTWYLADAPKEFYQAAFKVKKIDHIARALVDYTVQSGIEVNQEATLVLRADANGGERLQDFYKGMGLAPLPDDHPAISPGRFMANGGYFKLKPEDTSEFSSYMDVYRASRPRQFSPVEFA